MVLRRGLNSSTLIVDSAIARMLDLTAGTKFVPPFARCASATTTSFPAYCPTRFPNNERRKRYGGDRVSPCDVPNGIEGESGQSNQRQIRAQGRFSGIRSQGGTASVRRMQVERGYEPSTLPRGIPQILHSSR